MILVLKDKDSARDLDGRRFDRATPPVLVVDDGDIEILRARDDVEAAFEGTPSALLAGRSLRPSDHVVDVSGVRFGGDEIAVIAGPCSVETEAQIDEAAAMVARAGARALRGGAFKPRTSPYAFQGHGVEGLKMLAAAGVARGLPVVTEVMSPSDVDVVAEHADLLQVGARNMQNFALLKALGDAQKPVLLKRGFGCTVHETLASAEYILAAGNPDVILCERGIRTFESASRFTLDIAGLAWLKANSRLPVVVDPSHAAGDDALVPALAKAAVAAGADGLLVEVHPKPKVAWSDKDQALTPMAFQRLMQELAPLAAAVGRVLSDPTLEQRKIS